VHGPAKDLKNLDLLRLQFGLNAGALGTKRLELHYYVGVLGLRGKEWTPAFDMRVDTRVYPVRPLVLVAFIDTAVFAQGPVLVVADAQAGVSVLRFNVHAGVRGFWQRDAIAAVGPALDVSVKW
jgi:hypothetical protein